ncbi:MAG: ATP-binding cassette domain-containing protein, partial [Candidatus Eisenbacteria bacterium]|nr:ATP-binding cassette domain-containing protein [Candidatus Eisenbacteria bacterium]
QRGDRLAVVGSNGAGKSTLLRILAGREPVQSGRVHLAPEADLGFFSHDRIQSWDRRRTVLQIAAETQPDESRQRLRSLLGAFLFRDDDVDKTVGALSGGERSRLALACLLLRAPNLLVLDEPTNHLDLVSVDALLAALDDYTGTIVFVAHDRHFLRRLARSVAWPGGQGFKVYPGTYDEFAWAREKRPDDFAPQEGAAPRTETPPEPADEKKRRAQAERSAARRRQKDAQRRERRLREVEARIKELEERRRRHEEAFARPDFFDDAARAQPYLDAHKETAAELERLYAEWMQLQEGGEG